MSASKQKIGYFVQLGGAAACAAGAVLSVHHVTIAACFIGGAVALYLGKKIRSLA